MPTDLEELQKSWIQPKEERDTFETQFYASEKKVLELTNNLQRRRVLTHMSTQRGGVHEKLKALGIFNLFLYNLLY